MNDKMLNKMNKLDKKIEDKIQSISRNIPDEPPEPFSAMSFTRKPMDTSWRGQRKNEQETILERLWQWFREDPMLNIAGITLGTMFVAVTLAIIIIPIMLIANWRTYEDKLMIYEQYYSSCIETGISADSCENVALKESWLGTDD